ncbi:hypothetical protein NHU_00633 [Rhodovulum sulfidophilum]|uniref:Uncharacterized protein n=1 Tax=Rhodovulum sulfidophilum TaxID=35806 RepID=A0A0D6AY65_RHOSU|nr:hypothetical protein NHU_00633 [Rhodovulum sulfidophilum]
MTDRNSDSNGSDQDVNRSFYKNIRAVWSTFWLGIITFASVSAFFINALTSEKLNEDLVPFLAVGLKASLTLSVSMLMVAVAAAALVIAVSCFSRPANSLDNVAGYTAGFVAFCAAIFAILIGFGAAQSALKLLNVLDVLEQGPPSNEGAELGGDTG